MFSLKNVLVTAALVAGTAVITAQVVSGPEKTLDKGVQQMKDGAHDAMQDMMGSPEMQEMMKKWGEFATPGANHPQLKQWEGKWNLRISHRMGEHAPEMVSTATANSRLAMGGRYLVEKVEGEGMDMGDGHKSPFEGMAVMGFNNGTPSEVTFRSGGFLGVPSSPLVAGRYFNSGAAVAGENAGPATTEGAHLYKPGQGYRRADQPGRPGAREGQGAGRRLEPLELRVGCFPPASTPQLLRAPSRELVRAFESIRWPN